jgi:multiple sugar transport system substrate-binding protein
LYDPAKDKWIVNKQGLIDTLQFLKTVYVDEKLGDSVAALEAGSMDFLRRCNGLKDGKIAVVLDGCWNYGENWGSGASASWPNRNKELGWAPMPGNGKKDTPKRTCINGGWAWAINADTKHPDLAFEILKALENPKALSFHNSFTAHVPPRNDVELNEEFARDPAVIDFMERATKKLMPYSTYRPGTPDYPRISLLIQKMVESVCIGEQTPEQAYHWYVSKLKEIVGLDHISIE